MSAGNFRNEERRSPADDFADFLTGIYGEADPEKIALFRELLEDLDKETPSVTKFITEEI
jgi:hypothetical protein